MTTETAQQQLLVYVSAHLTTISVPHRPCWGEWLQMPDLSPHWHRQLSDAAFLYLRGAVSAAIKAGKLDPESAQIAESRLTHIQRLGRAAGQLTPSVENPFAEPLAGWQWTTGLPDLID